MRELKGDWRDLFNGFMLGLDLRKMFLGFVGILLTFATVGLFSYFYANLIVPGSVPAPDSMFARETADAARHDLRGMLSDVAHLHLPRLAGRGHGAAGAPNDVPHTVGRSLRVIFCCCDPRYAGVSPFKRLFGGGIVVLMFLLIWSYFGGAIARIAAVEVARDERIETQKALHFAHDKYWSFFWAPLVCVVGLAFFALCNVLGGGIGKILHYVGVGEILVAVLLPLAILSGFIMTLILIGTFFGLPLFAPAIATEGTDSFDAISRGFSYVYSRPWHYLFYQFVAKVYGAVCVWFVLTFGCIMIKLSLATGAMCFKEFRGVLSVLHGDQAREILTGPQTLALYITGAWLLVTWGILAGYAVSFFYSVQTIIYYLLRKKVDGIEMNEVYEEQEPEEAAEAAPADAPKTEPPGSGKPEDKPGA